MESILCQASVQSVENYATFSSTFGTKEDLDFLLQVSAQMAGSKIASSNILGRLTRVIPFLAFVNDAKMDAFIENFRQSLQFTQYDLQHSQEQVILISFVLKRNFFFLNFLNSFCLICSFLCTHRQETKLELFCALTSGIEHNAIGNTLKDRLVDSKVFFHHLIPFLYNDTATITVIQLLIPLIPINYDYLLLTSYYLPTLLLILSFTTTTTSTTTTNYYQ